MSRRVLHGLHIAPEYIAKIARQISLNVATSICQSGGAPGADLAWGEWAAKLGHKVVHFSFPGHRTRAPRDAVVELSADALSQADAHLARANRKLRRAWPPKSAHSVNRLRRNWYQIRDAERVYAVGRMDDAGRVEGGTAWAVTMFIDRHGGSACEVYFFDQDAERWLEWRGEWVPIDEPPVPRGVWAGIGTRQLNGAGEGAIRRLLASGG
jgi:hypothetical protein